MSLTPFRAAAWEEMEEICSQVEKLLGRVMCSDLLSDLKDWKNISLSLGFYGRRQY